MPLFYLDVCDDAASSRDEVGTEFESLGEARDHALTLLPHIALDALSNADNQRFAIAVRGPEKDLRYVVELVISGSFVVAGGSTRSRGANMVN